MSYQRCGHCGGYINTETSDHIIFNMHDGREVFVHHKQNLGCSHWYQQWHNTEIKCGIRGFKDDKHE